MSPGLGDAIINIRVGTLVAGLDGVTLDLGGLGSSLPAFVEPPGVTPDFLVSATFGDRPTPPGESRVLETNVDADTRSVSVFLTEWEATFSLPDRRVVVHFGGPWVGALETLLKNAIQIFGLELRSALCLHACSVARQGAGYVFMGRSGAGKSTAGLLSADAGLATLLREEITFVGGIAGKGDLSVSSLPIREKNRRSANVPLQVPLQGLYWLEQADEDGVEDIGLS